MPREASEMFQCIKYEDKREVFGLKIHSFSTLDRIKKYDDSDNEKNAEKPYSIKVGGHEVQEDFFSAGLLSLEKLKKSS